MCPKLSRVWNVSPKMLERADKILHSYTLYQAIYKLYPLIIKARDFPRRSYNITLLTKVNMFILPYVFTMTVITTSKWYPMILAWVSISGDLTVCYTQALRSFTWIFFYVSWICIISRRHTLVCRGRTS